MGGNSRATKKGALLTKLNLSVRSIDLITQLIDDNGMEVFSKYFTRLVVGNAPQIFGTGRASANPGNYPILVNEVRKIAQDVDQAAKIADSIDNSNEDIFRDFDLSGFMDHFKMDALERTVLALAFKQCSRSDLRAKGTVARLSFIRTRANNT